jgi:hypothetical protein
VTQVASAVVVASRARVTSTCNASTSALPRDRSCRNKMQEGMRMHQGSQRSAGSFFSFFRPTRMSTEASVSCSNLSAAADYEHADSASSPTHLQSIGGGRKTGDPERCSPDTPRPVVPKDLGDGAASPGAALLGTSMLASHHTNPAASPQCHHLARGWHHPPRRRWCPAMHHPYLVSPEPVPCVPPT